MDYPAFLIMETDPEYCPFFTNCIEIVEALINLNVLPAVAVNTALPFTCPVARSLNELWVEDDEIRTADGVTWFKVTIIGEGAAVSDVEGFLTFNHQCIMYWPGWVIVNTPLAGLYVIPLDKFVVLNKTGAPTFTVLVPSSCSINAAFVIGVTGPVGPVGPVGRFIYSSN